MKKKIIYITILAVIVLVQFFVAKQYIADRWFKKGCSELHEYDASEKIAENTCLKPLISDSSFKNAIKWDGKNPEIHYQLAKLYEKLMYRYGGENGKWETIDGKPVYNIGRMSKHFQDMAIREYYRAISLNPCANYYHLDLAWLLKSKSTAGGRGPEISDQWAEIRKAFKTATALAPNRTYNHKAFADWLIEHILYLKNNNKTENQYKKYIKALFNEAVCEYKKAVSLKPSMFNESVKSIARVSLDYDELKNILPSDNSGMKKLIFFLFNKTNWKENEDKFTRDMENRVARYGVTIKSLETIYPFYDTLASLYIKKKKTQKAIESLQAYLKIDPEHSETHFRLAGLYVSEGKQEFSKSHFKMAIALDPQNISFLKKYVSVLALWKKPVEEEEELQSLFKANPENVFIAETLGKLYFRQKRFKEAEDLYRKIACKTRKKARGYLLLGKLYEDMGKQEKTKIAYEKFIFYTPDKARGYFLLGKMYERQKNREKTRENYKKAALLNGKYKSYFNRMIPPDMLFEEYFKTIQDYDKLKKLIPLSPDSLNKLVLFLYEKHAWRTNRNSFIADLKKTKTNFEKSKGNANKEKKIRPWLLIYYKTLADIYVEKGNYRKACSILNEALKTDPENPEGHLLLAEYSFNAGNKYDYPWELSQDHYEKAIALSQGNYKYEKAYALSLAGVKRFEEAANHMKKAIEKKPNDPKLHEALGSIYEKAGNIDLAVEELSRAVSLSRGAERYKKKLSQLLTNS